MLAGYSRRQGSVQHGFVTRFNHSRQPVWDHYGQATEQAPGVPVHPPSLQLSLLLFTNSPEVVKEILTKCLLSPPVLQSYPKKGPLLQPAPPQP